MVGVSSRVSKWSRYVSFTGPSPKFSDWFHTIIADLYGMTNFSLVSDRWSKATQLFILVVKNRKQSKSGGGETMEAASLPFTRPISALITGAATQRPFSSDNLITWTE